MLELVTIKHKAIERLVTSKPTASIKGLDPNAAKKIRHMIAALLHVDHPNELRESFPGWRVHELTPGSPGKWSLTVTGNYRLTFELRGREIHDLNFEDYH